MKLLLSPASVRKYIDYNQRTAKLSDKITNTVFNYIRRGLFERDQLLVTTLIFFTLQVADGRLDEKLVNNMLYNKPVAEGPPVPESLVDWLPDVTYHRVLQLAQDLQGVIAGVENMNDMLTSEPEAWKAWVSHS